jgi:hypothetical protein
MADYFIRPNSTGLQGSHRFAAVTPHDTNRLTYRTRALYVGGAGNVVLDNIDDVAVTFAVAAGTFLQVETDRVRSTGTTATGIVAFY